MEVRVTKSIWIPIPYGPNFGDWGVCRRVYYDRRGYRLKAQYYYKGKVYHSHQEAQKVADKLNLKEWEKKKADPTAMESASVR